MKNKKIIILLIALLAAIGLKLFSGVTAPDLDCTNLTDEECADTFQAGGYKRIKINSAPEPPT